MCSKTIFLWFHCYSVREFWWDGIKPGTTKVCLGKYFLGVWVIKVLSKTKFNLFDILFLRHNFAFPSCVSYSIFISSKKAQYPFHTWSFQYNQNLKTFPHLLSEALKNCFSYLWSRYQNRSYSSCIQSGFANQHGFNICPSTIKNLEVN